MAKLHRDYFRTLNNTFQSKSPKGPFHQIAHQFLSPTQRFKMNCLLIGGGRSERRKKWHVREHVREEEPERPTSGQT